MMEGNPFADAAESRRSLRDGAEHKTTASGVGSVKTLVSVMEPGCPVTGFELVRVRERSIQTEM